MPPASNAMRNDTVPLTTPIACLQPCMDAKRRSNSATCLPSRRPQLPLRNVPSSRRSSALPKIGQPVNGRLRTGFPPKSANLIQELEAHSRNEAAAQIRAKNDRHAHEMEAAKSRKACMLIIE